MSEKIIQKGKKFINMDTQIQITGNHEVLVEGCKKILEYNDVFIKVKTWDMIIQVWGSGLKVSNFNIDAVFFCKFKNPIHVFLINLTEKKAILAILRSTYNTAFTNTVYKFINIFSASLKAYYTSYIFQHSFSPVLNQFNRLNISENINTV